MDLKLKGKRAIVTGGTRGIGRAIAETLAAEGVDIAFCARKPGEVEQAAGALAALGVRAFGGVADIADGEALKAWVTQAICELGGLDILICNASAVGQGVHDEAWNANFAVDVMGAQRAASVAMPHLEAAAAASGDAAILFISSVSAAETARSQAYGAMKAALIHYAKGLAKESAAKGVRVNTLSPGTILFDGGFWDLAQRNAPDVFAHAMRMNPTKRMGAPQEIADAAVFLCCPLSSFTTGANLIVDGAITSRVNF